MCVCVCVTLCVCDLSFAKIDLRNATHSSEEGNKRASFSDVFERVTPSSAGLPPPISCNADVSTSITSEIPSDLLFSVLHVSVRPCFPTAPSRDDVIPFWSPEANASFPFKLQTKWITSMNIFCTFVISSSNNARSVVSTSTRNFDK
jgi:hypothetical protein